MTEGKDTFSMRVRGEACEYISDSGLVCISEAAGFFAGCRCVDDDGVELTLRPAKRGAVAADRIAWDIRRFLDEMGSDDSEHYESGGRIFLRGELAPTMRRALRMLPGGDEEMRKAFFRGLFIGSGTVSDPVNQHYLDVSTVEEEPLNEAALLLDEYGITSSRIRRGRRYVLYVKRGDDIADVLKLVGATRAAMYYEEALCASTAANMSNRTYNCYSANVNKFISRKQRLRELITAADPTGQLMWAGDDMRETAAALLDDDREVLSLAELGARMTPPIGKSGAAHRLDRLETLLTSGK